MSPGMTSAVADATSEQSDDVLIRQVLAGNTAVFELLMCRYNEQVYRAARAIVRDDVAEIRAQVNNWIGDETIDVVLSTGGTGVTGRDVTPEAFEGLYEKAIPGFGELFRMLSYQKIGTSTIQSRATAGVAKGTYLFALPGSPGACRDAWDMILKDQLDYRHKPCNFVELFPRLREHERRK